MVQLIAIVLVLVSIGGGLFTVHKSIKDEGITVGETRQKAKDEPIIKHLTDTNTLLVANNKACEGANKALLAEATKLAEFYKGREEELARWAKEAEKAKKDVVEVKRQYDARYTAMQAKLDELRVRASLPATPSSKEVACENTHAILSDLARWMRAPAK